MEYPLWIFQHTCISVQGTKSRPRISGCLLRPWRVQSSAVLLVAPNCPPWLYCIFFGIPSLTVTFWGEIRLATQIAVFLRISAVVNTEKKTPCFFLSTLLFVSRITYHLKQVPQENWPHGQSLSQQLKMHGMCAQQWAKGSSSSWFSTRHMKNFTTATAYLRANSCICVF